MGKCRHSMMVGSLLAAFAVLSLAACGASVSDGGAHTTASGGSIPTIAQIWTGELIDNASSLAARAGVQLQQGADGSLSGQATMCKGIFGDKVSTYVVSGSITLASSMRLDFLLPGAGGTPPRGGFHFEGPYSATQMSLPGAFSAGQSVTLILSPASASDFTATCA